VNAPHQLAELNSCPRLGLWQLPCRHTDPWQRVAPHHSYPGRSQPRSPQIQPAGLLTARLHVCMRTAGTTEACPPATRIRGRRQRQRLLKARTTTTMGVGPRSIIIGMGARAVGSPTSTRRWGAQRTQGARIGHLGQAAGEAAAGRGVGVDPGPGRESADTCETGRGRRRTNGSEAMRVGGDDRRAWVGTGHDHLQGHAEGSATRMSEMSVPPYPTVVRWRATTSTTTPAMATHRVTGQV
jgi:hypothetical protein